MCLIFLTSIYFLKKNSNLKQAEWDAETITVGDYSVEYHITPKAYKTFLDTVYIEDRKKNISIGESLKTYLKKEIEDMMNPINEVKKT